ncbi:MAG: DUF805 domain-containing protein [Rhizobiaceae bacterium]
MPDQQPKPTVKWVLFGFDGRIARQSFILGQLFMISLFAVVIARIVAVEGQEGSTVFWGLAFLALGVASVVSTIAMTVKRLHDLGYPGILAVCMLIPTVNFIMLVLLLVLPSSPETNVYGPPPFGPTEKSG